jgi:short-chain dehydrogenase/reductase family protein
MKNIIITGTSRGIGYELVQQLAAEGHNILALSRHTATIESLNLPNVHCIPFDITLAFDRKAVGDFVKGQWQKVDILIHNAGRLINKPFEELTEEDFLEVYKVNVFGVAQLTRQLLPFMEKGSHVVSISSMGGVQGSLKFSGLAAYSSSKGALITLSELLAEEYKERGIVFNPLALGAVQTEMLTEAFPDYKANITPQQMARYIADFALNGGEVFNGKVLQVANTTP